MKNCNEENIEIRRHVTKIVAVVAVLIVFAAAFLLWPCSHEWEDATCTEAKTCTKCAQTEGEALGHNWSEASCTEPSACTHCKETKGTAMGHQWEQITETDYVMAKEVTYNQCTVCKEKESETSQYMPSLLSDDGITFYLTPIGYAKRLDTICTEMNINVECYWIDNADDTMIAIRENGKDSAAVFFYAGDGRNTMKKIQGSNNAETTFNSVQLVVSRNSSELDALMTAFVAACEPACAEDPDRAYETVVKALYYLGEVTTYDRESLCYFMNVNEGFVIMDAFSRELLM